MGENKTKVGIVIEAFDKATGNIKNINNSLKSFNKPFRGFSNQLKMFGSTSGLSNLKDSISNAGTAFMAFGRKAMLYSGMAAAGIGYAVQTAVDDAGKINDLSEATGMSRSEIQKLGYAFEQNGASPEEFNSSLETFSKNMGQVKAGYGRMFSALKKTGIGRDLLTQLKAAKNTDDAFGLLIDQLRKAKSESEKMALATAAVGPAASGLVNISKLSKEELLKLKAEIPIVGDEFIKAGDDAGDAFNRLSKVFKATKNNFALAFAPALTELSKGLLAKLNTVEVQKKIQILGKELNEALLGTAKAGNRFKGLVDTFKSIANALVWVAEDSTRLKIAFAGLVTLAAMPLIAALGSVASSLVVVLANYKNLIKIVPIFSQTLKALGPIASSLGVKFLWLTGIAAAIEGIIELIRGDGPLSREIDKLLEKFERFKWVRDLLGLKTEGDYKVFTKEEREERKKLKSVLPTSKNSESESIFSVGNLFPSFGPPLGIERIVEKTVEAKETTNRAEIKVSFENMPRGARAETVADKGTKVSLDTSYMGMQGVY